MSELPIRVAPNPSRRAAGASICKSAPGFYGPDGSAATQCPANTYCPPSSPSLFRRPPPPPRAPVTLRFSAPALAPRLRRHDPARPGPARAPSLSSSPSVSLAVVNRPPPQRTCFLELAFLTDGSKTVRARGGHGGVAAAIQAPPGRRPLFLA